MESKAILHAATRIILRLTTEHEPEVSDTEMIVVLSSALDLAGGPWKLDEAGNKVLPTEEEIIAAEVDPERVAAKSRLLQQALRDAFAVVRDDVEAPRSVQALAAAWLELQGN